MVKIKEKKCKGTGNAKGFGCGDMSDKRTYGLCPKCKYSWATSTEEGKAWFNKQTAYKRKKNEKETRITAKKEKAKAKLDLISTDKYRADYLQPVINKIVRLIDYGNPCIATGNYGKMNGGHYISVGANRTICLNLHNIFIQSFASNHWKSGDPLKYQNGLIETFGQDYFNYVCSLSQHKPVKPKKYELIEIRKIALSIVNRMKDDETVRTAKERIELRNQINKELNIYDLPFCEYHNENERKPN